MPKTSQKSRNKTKTSSHITKKGNGARGVSPSAGVIFTLAIALIVTITISVCAIQNIKNATRNDMAASKLAIFEHLADSYIREMEYTVENQPTFKQMTGYGVSDEDGVFYITFDFVPYQVDAEHNVTYEDARHGIMYFWEDKERGGYSHAFSYHDDASYHPGGVYHRIEH